MMTIILIGGIVAIAASLLMIREAWIGYPPARFASRVLTRKEQAILLAAGEALFPPGGTLPSAEQAGVVEYFDRMLDEIPRRQRFLIRVLLIFVEHGSRLFDPIRGRITRQSLEQRMQTFEKWETSNLYLRRLSFLSLRTLLTIAYFGDPTVTESLVAVEA